MELYAIQRREDGCYATVPGSKHSYSRNLQDAILFSSRQKAEDYGLCGNERVVAIGETKR